MPTIITTEYYSTVHTVVLPVVGPFLFRANDIKLFSIIHNETQADLHFAFVKLFVGKYIESRSLDVVTPLDLVEEINHGHGLKGTIS